MDNKFKLSAPWTIYYREIQALFGQDPEISIEYNEDKVEIKLYVTNFEKAEALQQLLPCEKIFGKVILKTTIVPANKETKLTRSVFQKAFNGNPAFSYVYRVDNVFTNPIDYVVFKKEVVQYFNDDLSDIHGVKSTLYEDIARDVFGNIPGTYFNTDTDEKQFYKIFDNELDELEFD